MFNRTTLKTMYLCTVLYGFIPYIFVKNFFGIPNVSFFDQSNKMQYRTLLLFGFLVFACFRVKLITERERQPRKINECIKIAISAPFYRH